MAFHVILDFDFGTSKYLTYRSRDHHSQSRFMFLELKYKVLSEQKDIKAILAIYLSVLIIKLPQTLVSLLSFGSHKHHAEVLMDILA